MISREDVDVLALLGEVVTPVLVEVLRPGELDAILVSWGGSVRLPDGGASGSTELVLELTCAGDSFSFYLWAIGNPEESPGDARERLRDALADFVAESTFGWGEKR